MRLSILTFILCLKCILLTKTHNNLHGERWMINRSRWTYKYRWRYMDKYILRAFFIIYHVWSLICCFYQLLQKQSSDTVYIIHTYLHSICLIADYWYVVCVHIIRAFVRCWLTTWRRQTEKSQNEKKNDAACLSIRCMKNYRFVSVSLRLRTSSTCSRCTQLRSF